jgi:hypothetical protein
MSLLRYQPSTFFHNFSMRHLVRKDWSRFGLESGVGGTGGGMGGGGGGGIGTGAQASGSRESVYGKSESFSCRVRPPERGGFDEASFIASLKEEVRDEITVSRAAVTGEGDMGASGFYLDYGGEGMHGRVIITGLLTQGGHYHLSASLNETSTSERPPLVTREGVEREPAGEYHVVAFTADDPRASSRDLHDVGVTAIKESTERIRQKLLADRSRQASLVQSLEYAEVYVWKQIPPEVRPRFIEATGREWETPEGFEQYAAVYFLNDVALRMYRDAGETFGVLKTIPAEEMPKTAHHTLGGPYVAKGE